MLISKEWSRAALWTLAGFTKCTTYMYVYEALRLRPVAVHVVSHYTTCSLPCVACYP